MPRSSSPGLQRLGERLFSWLVVPLLSLLAFTLLLEVVFRFLPVNEGCRTPAVTAQRPLISCEPNRTFTWSRFPDFSMTNRVHANNLGFINDQDYTRDSTQPLVAVVGDSLVEALMVPYAETVHGRMAAALQGRARVYSFGASGAQLGQYLAYTGYAHTAFAPAALVVVVAPNDFESSFRQYLRAPGFHYFVDDGSGGYTLQRFDFAPGRIGEVVRYSRLLLYLAINVDLANGLPPRTDPTLTRSADAQTMMDARRAADLFLDRLPATSGLPAARIAIVADAPRPIPLTAAAASAQHAAGGHDVEIRKYLLTRARALGFDAIDVEEVLLSRQSNPPAAMEFPHDQHWNPRAHAIVADAVLASDALASVTHR